MDRRANKPKDVEIQKINCFLKPDYCLKTYVGPEEVSSIFWARKADTASAKSVGGLDSKLISAWVRGWLKEISAEWSSGLPIPKGSLFP